VPTRGRAGFAGAARAASGSASSVRIFAESAPAGLVGKKEEFSVSFGALSGARKPTNVCARPSAGQPAAPDLPELGFRRDYLPAEPSRFQALGVTPPPDEITLRCTSLAVR